MFKSQFKIILKFKQVLFDKVLCKMYKIKRTCNLPSNVRCIVTHLLGCEPFVVIASIRLSNSSLFS